MAAEKIRQKRQKLSTIIKAYEDKLLIVVFHAWWCLPCRRLIREVLPVVVKQAGEGTAICPADVLKRLNHGASQQHRASNIPVTVFFRGGRELFRIPGLVKAEELLQRIKGFQK